MNIWDQQEEESDRYYAWFMAYADLSPAGRSVAAAYRVIKPTAKQPNGTFWEMYERFEWAKRAAARDRNRRARAEDEEEAERKKAIEEFRESIKKKLANTDTILTSLQAKLADLTVRLDTKKLEPDLKNLAAALGAFDRCLQTYHDLKASQLGLDDLALVADRLSKHGQSNAEHPSQAG